MTIIIAADKFKGSLSAKEVCEALKKGLEKASAIFHIICKPMSDGGDGLTEVLAEYLQYDLQFSKVQDPLGREVKAGWLLSADGKTAIIEMAKASGLQLLKPGEANPSKTSSFGTGQLIKEAINAGVSKIVLGIGGSATNDGGIGIAAALGYVFLDENGYDLPPNGGSLAAMRKIDRSYAIDASGIDIQVAADVKNPLLGPTGATRTYAAQKGADTAMIEALEKGMKNYNDVIKKDFDVDVSTVEGAGAAGGMGAGCLVFLQAKIVSGIELVMESAQLEASIKKADVVITGEGKLDDQSLKGKVVSGVAALAKKYAKPLFVICGSNTLSHANAAKLNATKIFCIQKNGMSLERAIQNAALLIQETAFEIGKSLQQF